MAEHGKEKRTNILISYQLVSLIAFFKHFKPEFLKLFNLIFRCHNILILNTV